MNNLDACSILHLINTTYFETVFDKNEDSVIKDIFDEIIKNESNFLYDSFYGKIKPNQNEYVLKIMGKVYVESLEERFKFETVKNFAETHS